MKQEIVDLFFNDGRQGWCSTNQDILIVADVEQYTQLKSKKAYDMYAYYRVSTSPEDSKTLRELYESSNEEEFIRLFISLSVKHINLLSGLRISRVRKMDQTWGVHVQNIAHISYNTANDYRCHAYTMNLPDNHDKLTNKLGWL